MDMHIRIEKPEDYPAVEELTREAFWGYMRPICDEHYLAHLLRKVPAFVPELDYVAEADGRLVGNVMYTKAKIIDAEKTEHEVLTFGPLSVLPSCFNHGVGAALMRHTIMEAKRLGYRAIVFYGHPDYYPRFGFCNAQAFGITSADGKNFDALMAMPLYDGALDGIAGSFHEDPAFSINAEEAEEFNSNFPHKEPAEMLSIDILLDKLEPEAQKAFSGRNIKTIAWLTQVSGRQLMQWEGIDCKALDIINKTLTEHGYPKKLLPSSYILQLAEMGVRLPVTTKIRSKDGISVYRAESEGEKYILKVFDKYEDTREIKNYMLLSDLNIPTLPMLKHTFNSLLLPDLNFNPNYRPGTEEDLSNPQIARAAARWYKKLHEKGFKYVAENNPQLYDEADFITISNMEFIANKTGTTDNPLWSAINKHFEKIRSAVQELPRTLTYNDFYWTNLVVSRDGESAMMLDFNLLGKGYAYGDLRNVTSSLTGIAANAFLKEYGEEHLNADEIAADAILSPLVTLYAACKRKTFPSWANISLEEVYNGKLLKKLQKWMEGLHG